jgi:hypothetical protein
MPLKMPIYDGIYDATIAALDAIFLMLDLLPPQSHAKLDTYAGDSFGQHSPVDVICNFVQSTYANRPALVPDSNVTSGMMLVAAGIGVVIGESHFWNDLDGKVQGIIGALRRDAGEAPAAGAQWPDPADDPAPADGFGPAAAAAPAPLPPPNG